MNKRTQARAIRTWLRGSIFVALAASMLVAAGKDTADPPHISSDVVASALGVPCTHDAECDDCDPCTLDDCLAGICVNNLIPDGLFVPGSECDDGLACNGGETCFVGVCVAGVPLCAPTTVCDEPGGECLPPCVSDDECELDGKTCTADVCQAKLCVGGFRDGFPCRFDDDLAFGCTEPGGNNGTCTGGGDGACVVGISPCGFGGLCQEPVAPETVPACGTGRCCVPGDPCARETFAECENLGGNWFAAGSPGTTCEDEPCPAYGVGIAPGGTPTTALGPIVSTNPQGCSARLLSAGDDYDTGAVGGFVAVEIVRFIAGVHDESRLAIQFWDTDQVLPVLIKETFLAANSDVDGPAVRTLVFDPSLVVPDVGAIALVNADGFTPFGASSIVAVQEAPVVGTSDPNKMWLNGEFVTGGVLGVCSGGTRGGLWCDLPGSLANCPGGVCDDIPDTLAFEIVASSANDPSGACCVSDTGACDVKFPWVCRDDGGTFQGQGTLCRACSNNPFASCASDADCGACTGDPATEGDFCVDDTTCGSGSCLGTASCTLVPLTCSVQACCAGSDIGNINVCNSASDNAGFFCTNGDTDCDGAGSACSDMANIAEGDCLLIRGGCSTQEMVCVGGDSSGASCTLDVDCPLGSCGMNTPCSQDSDCPTPGDTCLNNACPAGTGTGSGNFRSSCAPSVCVQPEFEDCPDGACVTDVCVGGGRAGLACLKRSGGDNCFDAPVAEAPVPTLQSPPISITTTITGDNADATYDDYVAGACDGGVNDGIDCDPDAADQGAECPDGTCSRSCGSGIFNPNGLTADPGWWEAFHISECANVRVSFCGSSLVVQPAWAFLSVGCPCDTLIETEGVDPPIGTGLRDGGSHQGDPFCSLSDNIWQTFQNLPPGTYYYPIYSGPDGTCASPIANPDSSGCTYQLQITTGACLEAACCVDATCIGGDDAGAPCDSTGLATCPDGACVGGTCDAGIMIGHTCAAGTVTQCPGGGVCTAGPACTLTNALRCAAAGGFFAAELNLPEKTCDGGPHQGSACEDDADCPASFCATVAGAAICPGVGLGVCEFGACCTGSGACGDSNDPLVLWDRQACAADTQGTGAFVAGARCNFPGPPCPICELEGPDFCQPLDGSTVVLSDLDGGAAQADNFVPQSSTIFSICLTGSWIDSDATGTRIDCACDLDDVDNCVPRVADAFHVRVFADNNGQAGALVGESDATVLARGADHRFENFDLWNLSLSLDTPIFGLSPGVCHWIEVTNNTTDAPSSCDWYWATGTADGLGASGSGETAPDASTPFDMAFCVDTGLDPAGCTGPNGACCDCNELCAITTQSNCTGTSWNGDDPACNDACPALAVVADDCASGPLPIASGVEPYQNLCATTDGPSPVDCETGTQVFGADIWYEYTAECDGVLTVSLCDGSDYDSILAVYGDETASCLCPLDSLAQRACDDDGCVAAGAAGAAAAVPPEPCTDPACGKGASELCLSVTQGSCYTVRIGGVDSARGTGNVKLGCAGSIIYADGAAAGANNGTSWIDAFTDLQDAVELAARIVECSPATPVPQIWVAGGTYRPDRGSDDQTATFVIADGVVMYGGFAGGESNLADRDPTANPTTLSGQLDGTKSFSVVTIDSAGAGTMLDGFIIADGQAIDADKGVHGGGLRIDAGDPIIANCEFTNNAANIGGAVYTEVGSPTFVNCLFSFNHAVIRSGAVHIQSGEPALVNCTVAQNTTDAAGRAGGIGIASGRPVITSCAVSGNSNGDGSGEDAQIQVAGGAPVLRYNCIEGLATLAGGFGNVVGNDIFVSLLPGAEDFRLKAGSACIDAGDSLSVLADLTDMDGDGDTDEPLPFDLARVERFLNDGATPDSGRFALNRIVDIGAFEFEPDCNKNFVRDDQDIATLASPDCNGNEVPDECEIDENAGPKGTYFCVPDPNPDIENCDPDCDNNQIPDACVTVDRPDCNENGIPDFCENRDCTPGEDNYPGCENCHGDILMLDECTLAKCPFGDVSCDDCNGNGRPDSCDIADGTSLDTDPSNGVPDECLNAVPGGEGNFSDGVNWQGGTVPGGGKGATLTNADLDVDQVNTTVLALHLESQATLNVDFTGNMSVDKGIRNEGLIVVGGRQLSALSMDLSGTAGVLDIKTGAGVNVGADGLKIEQGGFLRSSGSSSVTADITAGSADIIAGVCGSESGMALRHQMSVTTDGNFQLDGRMDVHPCIMPRDGGTFSARGGKTPPILRVGSPTAVFGSSGSARGGATPGLTVKGDMSILHAVEVCVACDPAEPADATVALEGDFDNQSRYATLYDWRRGGLRLQGPRAPLPPDPPPTTQMFEVAGVDIGPMGGCSFLTREGTNTESVPLVDHSNFAIGKINVAAGSHVTFRNAYSNSAGTGHCAEALYVDTLRLEGDAAIRIENCRVYFNELIQDSPQASITTVGCGALVSNIPGNECLYGPITAADGANPFSTECADGDGPDPIICETGSVTFDNDIWFSYTATCTGVMIASLCGATDFDSVLSLHLDPSNRTVCECPTSSGDLLGCANDTCGSDGALARSVLPGDCVLVRVGGIGGARGAGSLDIQCQPADCAPSSEPVPDEVFGEVLTMNRALAFSAGDPGMRQAIRVTVDSVTAAHHEYLVGSSWWVQAPQAFGEQSASPSPGVGTPNFLASELGCTPFVKDWHGACVDGECEGGLRDGSCQFNICIGGTNEGSPCTIDADCPGDPCTETVDCGGGIINVYGEMVVPGASYTVSVADESCDLGNPGSLPGSSVTMITSNYGDVAGVCSAEGCVVPDGGQVAVADALAILAKFANAPGAMRKMRADLEPSLIDFRINVTDVLQALSGFVGVGYPFLSCVPTAASGNLCFGGPTHLSSCTTDLECRVPLCPGGAAGRISTALP